MDGWRGRVGIVSPDDAIIDDEYWRFVPDGVNVLVTRFTTPTRDAAISPEMVDTYADLEILKAAADTLKITRPGAIGFACNSCSFVRGRGWDIAQGEALSQAAGCPGTTISSAMMQALRLFDAKTVSVCAPYPNAVTERLRAYLGEHGISVAALQSSNSTPNGRSATPIRAIGTCRVARSTVPKPTWWSSPAAARGPLRSSPT